MAIFDAKQGKLDDGERVNITFTADGPARFTLQVDENGNTHLFGYSGETDDEDEEQDPNLVFDTDGSFAVFTDEEA